MQKNKYDMYQTVLYLLYLHGKIFLSPAGRGLYRICFRYISAYSYVLCIENFSNYSNNISPLNRPIYILFLYFSSKFRSPPNDFKFGESVESHPRRCGGLP